VTTDDDPFLAVPDGARHRALAELAARGPVHRMRLATGADAWVVTGYAEAKAVLTDPRVVKGGASHTPFGDELPPELFSALSSHLLITDPPEHTRLRRLVSAAFTRRRGPADRGRADLDGLPAPDRRARDDRQPDRQRRERAVGPS
jgi:cytochrome P450